VLTFTTAANSATQLSTSAEMRGRVMGLYMLVFLGGTPIGSPLVGWIAEVFGARMSMISGGVISGLATLVIAALLVRRSEAGIRERLRSALVSRFGARRGMPVITEP